MKDVNNTRYLIGVIIVLIGVGFFFDQWGIFSFNGYSFWNLISALWGIFFLYFSVNFWKKGSTLPAIFFFIIGIGIIFQQLFHRNIFESIWPLFIIGVGLSMLFRSNKVSNVIDSEDYNHGVYMKDEINDSVAFWGVEKKIESSNFKGGKISCMFGSEVLNIRNVDIISTGATIDISCVFGSVKIKIPKNCKVEFNGSAVFGNWSHRYKGHTEEIFPVLRLTGSVTFGEVEIVD